MLHRYAVFFIVFAMGRMAAAQCTVPVPSDAIIMLEDDSSTAVIQQAMFICSGVYVSASSVDPVIFLESGAHMNFSGFSKNIYAKAGSIVDGSGIDDTIYYETGAQLLIGGINQTLIACDLITFSFGAIGSSPCELNTGISDPTVARYALYPTLASDRLQLVYTGQHRQEKIHIVDLAGRTVLHTRVQGPLTSLDVSAFPPGSYAVVVTSDALLWTGRFYKE